MERILVFTRLRVTLILAATAFFSPLVVAFISLPAPLWQASSASSSLRLSKTDSSEPPPVFPISTRTALIEKAMEFDEKLASGEHLGGYTM